MAYNYDALYHEDGINPEVIHLLENNNLQPNRITLIKGRNLGNIYRIGFTDLLDDTLQREEIMKAVKEWSDGAPNIPQTEKTFSALAILDETEEE